MPKSDSQIYNGLSLLFFLKCVTASTNFIISSTMIPFHQVFTSVQHAITKSNLPFWKLFLTIKLWLLFLYNSLVLELTANFMHKASAWHWLHHVETIRKNQFHFWPLLTPQNKQKWTSCIQLISFLLFPQKELIRCSFFWWN